MCESLVYYLEQHTPLIHFQSGEQGAGLRASEIKPRFDRFLHQKYGDKLLPYKKMKDKDALDYRLEIINRKSTNLKDFNESIISEEDKYFLQIEEIILVFNTNYKEINKMINDSIFDFFEYNNFGYRKSKGYGSFSVKEEYIKNENISNKDRLKNIENFHRNIRKNIEKKSGDVALSKNIKKFLDDYDSMEKSDNIVVNLKEELDSKKLSMSRDLLGLATHESWCANENGNRKLDYSVKKECFDKNIARYESPILYKITKEDNEYKTYIYLKDLEKTIEKLKFNVNIYHKENDENEEFDEDKKIIKLEAEVKGDLDILKEIKNIKNKNFKIKTINNKLPKCYFEKLELIELKKGKTR